MTTKTKIIIGVSILIVGAGAAYYFLVYKKKVTPVTTPATTPAGATVREITPVV